MKPARLTLIVLGCLIVSVAVAQSKKRATPTIQLADSLFQNQLWADASAAYEVLVKSDNSNSLLWNKLGFSYQNQKLYDKAIQSYVKSLSNKPNANLEALVQSRLARIYAVQSNISKAFESLDEAIAHGYRNLNELDTHSDFESIRTDKQFPAYRKRVYNTVYPCMANEQARQFDFWIGEWDAYVRGTQQLAGRSRIDMASGGCMILENWTSLGGPFEGKSINFVDPESGKWKQVWVGSGKMPNVTEFLNGEYRDGAMRFEYETTDAQGNKTLNHFHFYNESPDQVRQLFKTSTDNGLTWTVGYDFTYVRKKKS